MKKLALLTLLASFSFAAQASGDYIQLERNHEEVLGEVELGGLFSVVEQFGQKTCLLEVFDNVKLQGIPYEKCFIRGPRPSPFTPGKCLEYRTQPAPQASYRKVILPQNVCDLRSIARFEGEIVSASGTLVFANQVYRSDRRVLNDVEFSADLFYHFSVVLGDDTVLNLQ